MARQEERKEFKVSENKSDPKKLLKIAYMDKNEGLAGPLNVQLPTDPNGTTDTVVDDEYVRTQCNLVATDPFKDGSAEQGYESDQDLQGEI